MAETEWTCQHCTCLNSQERFKCIACDSDLIKFGGVSTQKEDEWTCQLCTMNNSISLLNCQACLMRHPQAPGIDATEDHAHAVDEPISATAWDVVGDWVCPSCSSSNPVTSLNCVHCDDDQWDDVWSCPYCTIDNPMDTVVCKACEYRPQLLSTGSDVDAPQTQHLTASLETLELSERRQPTNLVRRQTEASLSDTNSTSPRPSVSTISDIHPQRASAAVCEVSTSTARKVSDEMINNLAKEVPTYAYDKFSEKLGIGQNPARNIVEKHRNDYEKATKECIAKWRDRSTRSVADLHEVLRAAELGGLIVHCN